MKVPASLYDLPIELVDTVPPLPAPKSWRSCAEWPDGALSIYDRSGNITTDEHNDKERAEGVCMLLSIFGLGAEGKILPVRTWVEEIP